MRTHSTTFQIGAKAQAITIQADEALALSMTRAIQGARDGRISAADEKRKSGVEGSSAEATQNRRYLENGLHDKSKPNPTGGAAHAVDTE